MLFVHFWYYLFTTLCYTVGMLFNYAFCYTFVILLLLHSLLHFKFATLFCYTFLLHFLLHFATTLVQYFFTNLCYTFGSLFYYTFYHTLVLHLFVTLCTGTGTHFSYISLVHFVPVKTVQTPNGGKLRRSGVDAEVLGLGLSLCAMPLVGVRVPEV
jgi:hypothetical protein